MNPNVAASISLILDRECVKRASKISINVPNLKIMPTSDY